MPAFAAPLTSFKHGVILIDMNSGDRFMPTAGKLWDNLKTAGIDKAKLIGFRLPYPGIGMVEKKDNACRFAAA
ncbi:MAG TPA: hypothetical protein VNR39_22040 [Pseudolabrys sp.]|nr:hypothetical protein [Pseudolabrys sp.]